MTVFGFEIRGQNWSSKIMLMSATRLRRIFVIAGIASLFVSYLGLWLRMIGDPVERTGSDFIAFYSAGRVAQDYGAVRVYDPKLQQQIQEDQVGFPLVPGQVLLYNHLPFLIPVLEIVVGKNYVASFYRWLFLLVSIYGAGVFILGRLLQQHHVDRQSNLLATVGALLFLPVFFSLMNGQDTAILFLGTVIWMYGLISGREYLTGFGLSLTIVRPHIALILAAPMIFRSFKVFGAFLFGSGILALLSILIVGPRGIQDYANILLVSAGGEWYGMKEYAMYNLIGLLTRTVPGLDGNSIRLIGWLVYGIAILALCILWGKSRNSAARLIGLSTTLALFAAPHLHFHDLALLLIPIYELIRGSTETEAGKLKTSIAILLPLAISLLLLLSNISPYLQYTVPYLIMLFVAGYPYYGRRSTAITIPHRS